MNFQLCFLLLVICGLSTPLVAQNGLILPEDTYGSDWHLGVSDVHTTTLVFPNNIVSVDRGTPDILTQTLDEVTNIVKVKSASEEMEASSLTVITSGGMIYTFRVTYDENPSTLTYHLSSLRSPTQPYQARTYSPPALMSVPMNHSSTSPAPNYSLSPYNFISNALYYPSSGTGGLPPTQFGTPISFGPGLDTSDNPMGVSYGRTIVNTQAIRNVGAQVHGAAVGRSVATDQVSGSWLSLNDIWTGDDIIYFRFTLVCESNIAYDIDFWRFYVIDAKQRKRTAVQERDVELLEVFSPGQESKRVESRKSRTFVVAVNKFTIPDKKRLVLEIFERDGGRHHRLKIKNKDIVRAELVSTSPITK